MESNFLDKMENRNFWTTRAPRVPKSYIWHRFSELLEDSYAATLPCSIFEFNGRTVMAVEFQYHHRKRKSPAKRRRDTARKEQYLTRRSKPTAQMGTDVRCTPPNKKCTLPATMDLDATVLESPMPENAEPLQNLEPTQDETTKAVIIPEVNEHLHCNHNKTLEGENSTWGWLVDYLKFREMFQETRERLGQERIPVINFDVNTDRHSSEKIQELLYEAPKVYDAAREWLPRVNAVLANFQASGGDGGMQGKEEEKRHVWKKKPPKKKKSKMKNFNLGR